MRYALADEGQATYAIESSAYSKESTVDQYLGYLTEDISFPGGQNPHTQHSSGGTDRKPYNQSPDVKEFDFEIPILPYDSNIPLEIAIGSRAQEDITDDDGAKVGTRHKFRLGNTLPTATIRHDQKDLGVSEWFIGTKASLDIEASIGDPLQMTLNCMAAKHEFDDAPESFPSLELPKQKSLFRFHMRKGITLGADPLLALSGFSASIDNGLEALYHGENNRDAYAIAETTNSDLFDVTLNATILDLDLYKKAVNNESKVDIEIPIIRGEAEDGTNNDGVVVRFLNSNILTADIPFQSEGNLEHDIEVAPEGFEVDILEPA